MRHAKIGRGTMEACSLMTMSARRRLLKFPPAQKFYFTTSCGPVGPPGPIALNSVLYPTPTTSPCIFVCAPWFPSHYTLTNFSPSSSPGEPIIIHNLLFHQMSPVCSSDHSLPTASRHALIQNSRARALPTWRPGPVGITRSHSLTNDAPPRHTLDVDVDLGGG